MAAEAPKNFGQGSRTFEETTRTFIESEIETGTTLAGLAATEYDQGQPDRGRKVTVQVQRAVGQAEQRLRKADGRGWDVTALRQRLQGLGERLARREARKG